MGFICNLLQAKTAEEIVAANSALMTDAQKAQYWYELSQNIFAILGKVEVTLLEISTQEWIAVAQSQYPTLTEVKLADSKFFTTTLSALKEILTRDWTNIVPYIAETGDCDKFATRLYSHLCDYYKINAVIPVWGDTDKGYHGFNLAVVRETPLIRSSDVILVAKLIEPQTDEIFVDQGPLGKYVPRLTAIELGIKREGVG